MAPLEPQEKGFALADWHLKSCAACGLHSRWQLCCLTDVAYPLRVIRCLPGVVSKRLGLLLSSLSLCLRFGSVTQFPPTLDLYRFAIACRGGFAGARRVDCTIGRKWFDYAPAVRTTENACTVDRRKLGCTSARSAERQRMLGAEANRLATPNAATPRAGSRIPEAQRSFKLWTANLSLSLGVPKGPFSFAKENGPFDSLPCAAQGNKVQRCRAVICYP